MNILLSKTRWQREFSIGDEESIREFARLINDTNPLHHDNRAAKNANYPGIIAPGVMLAGFISSAMAAEIPGVIVRRLEMEFLYPVYAKTTLFLFCDVLKQKGRAVRTKIVISNGVDAVMESTCLLWLPEVARMESIAA